MTTKATGTLELASTKPGHTWRLTCYKGNDGFIRTTAQEGRCARRTYRDGLSGTRWETAIGLAGDGDRRFVFASDLPRGAPLTKRRIGDGLYLARTSLIFNGLATDGPLELFEDIDERDALAGCGGDA